MASYIDQVSSLAPKVWFRFNETAGTPGNSGSLTTTGTFNSLLLNEQTDVDGRATYYDGSSAYIGLDAWPAYSLLDDKSFTIEFWFKLATQDTNTRPLLQFGSIGTQYLRMFSMGSSDANSGKLLLSIAAIGEQVADREMYSTNTYFDSKWHHAVVAVNTTSLKWYIDGNLETTKTLTTGALNLDSVAGNRRLIAGSAGFSGNVTSIKYKGWLDEFAMYGYELNSSQVLANFNAGASVNYAASVSTASATSVMPTWAVECVQAAAPMTASSLFVETLPSNFDYVDGIQKIISDLAPETWLKFDYVTDYSSLTPNYITNYGSGGAITYSGGVYADIYQTGPAQEPTAEFQIGSDSNHVTSTTSGLFTTEISDSNFSIGVWFKVPTGIDTSEKQIFGYAGPNHSPISLKINNKKAVFALQTSHTTYTHTETNDISENVWHLAVIKLDLAATTLKYYLDGTEVHSDTGIQGNRATPTSLVLGKATSNGTDTGGKRLTLAHYFVDTYSDVTPTIITNLYNAGTRQNQAKGVMRQPVLRFSNKYDETVQALNPLIQLGLNETTGTAVENVGSSTGGAFVVVGSNYTRGTSVLTKNRYGYNFTNKDTRIGGNYATATNTFSDNTKTVSVYAKINTVSGSDLQIIHFDGGSGGAYGIGLSLLANSSGPLLAIIATTNPATWGTISAGTTYFGDWHLYTMVRDGSSVKLYIDGKQVGSTLTYSSYNLSDSGFTSTGGGETAWFAQAAATVDKYVDEVAVFDYALTNQQIFDMWQSIEIDKGAASSELVMPTNIAGTGYTDTSAPMTATALLPMPTEVQEIQPPISIMTAFAEFLLPNFGGNVVIDANYGHSAATATAELHMPQYNIGESNGAASMDASALMVHPLAIIAGAISVPPLIALDATLVMPGIVTIKGARVRPEPMTSQAIFPLPPAYLRLADDPWYVRLYAEHFDNAKEPLQTTLGSIAGAATTGPIQGGFLTFFDDVTVDITPTTAVNTFTSEIGKFAYVEPDQYDFESNGDLIPLDTTGEIARATSSRQSSTPQSILSAGLFDPFERKAVRVTNIEFPFQGTDKAYSERPYHIEFSIKTTKSDQVLTHGYYSSPNVNTRIIGAVGLSDGKIYLAQQFVTILGTGLSSLRAGISTSAPHPKNFLGESQYLIGRANIADGNWHHVIIQKGFGSENLRTQIWVDGQLDRQIIVPGTITGINGTNQIRPYILGFNSTDPLLYSDFQTSAWNFYPGRFIDSRSIGLNYSAYVKSVPIKVQPFTASVTTPQNHKAAGNRARALMLFFWPKTGILGTGAGSVGRGTIDYGASGGLDEETFDSELLTLDLPGEMPQQYFGWDIFPLDVTGSWGNGYTAGSVASDMLSQEVWVEQEGYRDINTGARRYLDLMKDIDISQFDSIFFKNFPEQSVELDRYVREESADTYFGLAEEDLYRNFLVSLRAAVDTGISLYITNAKLAYDLGIIDNYQVVDSMTEADFQATDNFVTSKLSGLSIKDSGVWKDTNKNNKFRIVNTLPGFTDEPGYVWRDWMYFYNYDDLEYGGPNLPFTSVLSKPNGLQVGDEFLMSDSGISNYQMEATPFVNVKAGKIITAFSNTINQNGTEVENPYKNYATIIALEPGTILKGKATGGKILVNFTERLSSNLRGEDGLPSASRDNFVVELIQDEFINIAYQGGLITLAKKNELLASAKNLDRLLEAAIAAGQPTASILNMKYWSFNGNNILSQKIQIDQTGSGTEKDGLLDGIRATRINKVNKQGSVSTTTIYISSQWFTFTYSYANPLLMLQVPSMFSRGFRWLSSRIFDEGLVNRVAVMNSTNATLPMPAIVIDRIITVSAEAMISNARIVHAPGYSQAAASITTLPLTATARFGEFVKNIKPDVFTASARAVQPRTSAVEEDEIVIYMHNVEATLYLREDVIK